ncbi:hypothetical protein ERHA54_42470 [Erwinia rhapontici]|uniref:Uncharacterized protein n=1 Tax=Erwinia rhapontici TaxID=55212 RepID=A0ABN6DPP3_ERWRD|nr:hypothetical protein [Erwinia rhapontici]MCS3608108.1 hypothetical protein [Erwinia rhapontici]TDT00573.1 hypothetical protein EDF84_102303 [Erwinia rhapontici]BCQ36646.1 hypothetical protein ERHA53_39890 [Erwinia rhapontici]BCQ41644.1 hypothetical protein ERHA54_42470 [Erwinia rhapontici]
MSSTCCITCYQHTEHRSLFDRLDKKVSERRDKEAGFVSLKQICL